MAPIVILNTNEFEITINRLAIQLIENHDDFSNSVLIGLQPRGVYLAQRIQKVLKQRHNIDAICGGLDITFYRDDFRRTDKTIVPSITDIDFEIENKNVILIDDVLYSGRTVRAGLDAMLSFGRPKQVELLCLIDRRFSRHLPIQADYVGKQVDSISSERVQVSWKELEGNDEVTLFTPKDHA
ncbi:MAG: bifunctional pyr operon transcriptional regulator/uracil phosphoribosyltransferase PyrR [Bacteroidia bacterium]